ncbi:hypothetical protein [Micrococcus luteus]|uniref:hypothetical protein n=1 Tax=Micrococcus luteus TaxID=1270 RepID=UPI0030190E41
MMTTPTAHRIAKHAETFVKAIADDSEMLEALAVHLNGEQEDALHDLLLTCGEEQAAHALDSAWAEATTGE